MSAAPSTTERGPKTAKARKGAADAVQVPALPANPTWDEVLSVLDEHLPELASYVRRERDLGTSLDGVLDALGATAKTLRVQWGLDQVFDKAEGLNLTQDEIEFALDELKHGADPDFVLNQITGARHDVAAWTEAMTRLDDAKAALVRAEQAVDGVAAEYEKVRVATPEVLAAVHIFSERQLESCELPLEKKAELLPVLRVWRAATDAARTAIGLDASEAAADAADDAVNDARDHLMTLRPPTLDALHMQMGERLDRATDWTVTSCAGLARLMHEGSDEVLAGVQSYLDLSRLLNKRIAREWDAFDPALFVRVWESLPGHYFAYEGAAAFLHPDAWPVDRASDEAVTVGQEVMDRLEAAWNLKYPQAFNALQRPSATGRYLLSEFYIQFADDAYPDEPEQAEALKSALSSRIAGPIGREWWESLEDWQRSRVRRYRLERSKTQVSVVTVNGPEWRKLGAERSEIDALTGRAIRVIRNGLMNRGRFYRDAEGVFSFGGPLTGATSETMGALADAELSTRLKQIVVAIGLLTSTPLSQEAPRG